MNVTLSNGIVYMVTNCINFIKPQKVYSELYGTRKRGSANIKVFSYLNIDTTVHKCCSSCSVGTCLKLLSTRWPMIITLKIGLWPQECTTSHSNANIPSVTLLPPVFLNIMRTSHRGIRLVLIVLLINLQSRIHGNI